MRWEGGGAHQAVHHLEWEGLTRQYFTWRGNEIGRGGARQVVLHLEVNQ